MTEFDEAANLRELHTHPPVSEYLSDMWRRRDFAVALPMEQIRAAHQDTFLGNLWHLGNPMLSVLVYYVVFGVVLEADRGVDNYVLWLMVGVFAYGLTSGSVQGGARSISTNQGLMGSFRFPRAMLPLSVIISNLVSFGYQLIVLAGVAIVTGEGLSRRWAALPLVVLVHTALNLGGAFFAARLNDSFRDVEQLIPYVFRLLVYASGVMIPLEAFLTAETPAWVTRAIELNPLVQMLELYRWVFLGTPVDLSAQLRLVLVSAASLLFGFRFFRANEWRYGRN